jgi:hypothetical protein
MLQVGITIGFIAMIRLVYFAIDSYRQGDDTKAFLGLLGIMYVGLIFKYFT